MWHVFGDSLIEARTPAPPVSTRLVFSERSLRLESWARCISTAVSAIVRYSVADVGPSSKCGQDGPWERSVSIRVESIVWKARDDFYPEKVALAVGDVVLAREIAVEGEQSQLLGRKAVEAVATAKPLAVMYKDPHHPWSLQGISPQDELGNVWNGNYKRVDRMTFDELLKMLEECNEYNLAERRKRFPDGPRR